MKNNGKKFPYPVLSKDNNDILESHLNFEYIPKESQNLILDVKIDLKNKTIESLIKDKKAIFVTHIECAKTKYRTTFKSFNNNFTVNVDNKSLKGKVDISSMIISTEDINYINEDWNEDYSGDKYYIGKNKILAYDEDYIIDIERNTDSLENLPSIFSIVPNTVYKAPPMDLDTTGNKIKISLNSYNFENYKILYNNQQLEQTLASIFIVPALISVLTDFHKESDDCTLNWYLTIERRLNELKIPIDEDLSANALKYTHLILGNNLEVTLDKLKLLSLGDEE